MSSFAVSGTPAVDVLQDERLRCSFAPRQLTYLLDGGEARTLRAEQIRGYVEEDPVFKRSDKYFLTRGEEYERAMQKNAQTIKRILELGLSDPEDVRVFADAVGELFPLSGLHHSMFIPTIQSQASKEQKEKWLPLALSYQIIGTYAQTELGHGTFLRGIETTATLDIRAQEFVINTPTITAMKWWPGSLGKVATHCILMARLIIKDKDYGVHPFFVQLRSLENHQPLAGISLGDIGPKFNWNSIDNGWLRLDNVRIPRESMLMRYAKVAPDGTYTQPPHAKIAYGTMVRVRAGMVGDAFKSLARSSTIAIRYSLVRRQGYVMGTKDDATPSQESKVMDYGTQQASLFPLLAGAYALKATSSYMMELFNELTERLAKGDFSTLPEVHATSAGLKAFSTWLASDGTEECRKRCGGHGFLRTSGLPDLVSNTVPSCTYEGDNNVLLQQTASYLLKALRAAKNGEQLVGNVQYFAGIQALHQRSSVRKLEELLEPRVQMEIYEHKAICLTELVATRIEKELGAGKSSTETWNYVMPDLYRMTKAHCYLIMTRSFINFVESSRASPNSSPAINAALKSLCDLFALYNMDQDIGDLLIDGYFKADQVELLKKQVKELYAEIRKSAIGYVDAFNFSDHTLNSALGRYDGRVYEALYEMSLQEPLNKTEVIPGYQKYIKPFIQRASL